MLRFVFVLSMSVSLALWPDRNNRWKQHDRRYQPRNVRKRTAQTIVCNPVGAKSWFSWTSFLGVPGLLVNDFCEKNRTFVVSKCDGGGRNVSLVSSFSSSFPPAASTNVDGGNWLRSLVLPLLLVHVSNHLSRSCIYYLVDFSKGAKPFHAVNIDVGFSEAEYGILASIPFTVLYAITSLGAGIVSDRYNRKSQIFVAALTWSIATIGTAQSRTFRQIFFFRLVMSLACAFLAPAAYTLLRERAPPQRAALASSIYGAGYYVATAISSLAGILLNSKVGWRNTYALVAMIGLLTTIVTALLLDDDKQNDCDNAPHGIPSKVPSQIGSEIWTDIKTVFSSRRVQWILVGSLFRFSAGFMIVVWSGVYFRMIFTDKQSEYAVAQAVISLVGATLSGLMGGATADWLTVKASKSAGLRDPDGQWLWVVAMASILAAPTWYYAIQTKQSFESAMVWLAAEYFVAESWFGPTMNALLSAVDAKVGGMAQGIYTSTVALANFAPSILGVLYSKRSTDFGTARHAANSLSTMLAFGVGGCYVTSAIFFALAANAPLRARDKVLK